MLPVPLVSHRLFQKILASSMFSNTSVTIRSVLSFSWLRKSILCSITHECKQRVGPPCILFKLLLSDLSSSCFSFLLSLVSPSLPSQWIFSCGFQPLYPHKRSSSWYNSKFHCDSWLSSSLLTIERQQQLSRERSYRATNSQKGFQRTIRGAAS